jgi:hypothetical protein
LQAQPGQTWQQRWQASGAEAAGTAWRQIFLRRDDAANVPEWRKSALSSALAAMISADYLRPSLPWLTARTTGQGTLARELARSRDPERFTRLLKLCDNDPDVAVTATSHTLALRRSDPRRGGGRLADITVGDVLELLKVEADLHVKTTGHAAVFYRMLHRLGAVHRPRPASRIVTALRRRTAKIMSSSENT